MEAEARQTYGELADATGYSTDIPFLARANLSIMDVLRRDGAGVLHNMREHPAGEDPYLASVWAATIPLGKMLSGQPAEPPDDDQLHQLVALGKDGLFIARALGQCLSEAGRNEDANHLQRTVRAACTELDLDYSLVDSLMDRFRAGGPKAE